MLTIATATCSAAAVSTFLELLPKDSKFKLITGIDIQPSVVELRNIEMLSREHNSLSVFLCAGSTGGIFHPKVYRIDGEERHSFVGSGNFTLAGLGNSTELFVRSTDPALAEDLDRRLREWENEAHELTQELLNSMPQTEEETVNLDRNNPISDWLRAKVQKQSEHETDAHLSGDFSEFYFDQADYLAFESKTQLDTSNEANKQRRMVRNKLYELNSQLIFRLKDALPSLHPHYHTDSVVSSEEHTNYTTERIQNMWLDYGRDKPGSYQLKKLGAIKGSALYPDGPTPRWQPRIQIAIAYEGLSTWLRIGKPSGSRLEREILKKSAKAPSEANEWFTLFAQLPTGYVLFVGEEAIPIENITDSKILQELFQQDRFTEYFYLLRTFHPLDKRLKKEILVSTIVKEMEALFPLYQKLISPVDRMASMI